MTVPLCSTLCGDISPEAVIASGLLAGSISFVDLSAIEIDGQLFLEGTEIDPLPLGTAGPLESGGAVVAFVPGALSGMTYEGDGVLRYIGPARRVEVNADVSYRLLFHDIGIGVAVDSVFVPETEALVSADSSGSGSVSTHFTIALAPGQTIQIFWVEHGQLVPVDPSWFLLSAHLSAN